MSTTQRTIGSLGYACREDVGTPETRAEARRDLSALKLELAIQKAVAAAPPLTDEQRARLASLLSGGAR